MMLIHLILPIKADECHSSSYFEVRCKKPGVVMDRGECTDNIEMVTCHKCVQKGEG